MEKTPANCPVCGTAVPKGAEKCPGCGSVFGEQNRCPHCHAVAAVRPGRGGFVCMACGKPRTAGPGVTVFRPPPSAAARGASATRRTLGILSIAGGVIGAALAAVAFPGVAGLAVAAAVGALGVGVGAAAMRSGAGMVASASLEHQVIALAEQKGGALFVTDVAQGLHLTQADADALLTSMADGSRVSAEVTSDGLVRYVFRELGASSVKVRIADPLEDRFEALERAELEAAEEEVEAFLNPRPSSEQTSDS